MLGMKVRREAITTLARRCTTRLSRRRHGRGHIRHLNLGRNKLNHHRLPWGAQAKQVPRRLGLRDKHHHPSLSPNLIVAAPAAPGTQKAYHPSLSNNLSIVLPCPSASEGTGTGIGPDAPSIIMKVIPRLQIRMWGMTAGMGTRHHCHRRPICRCRRGVHRCTRIHSSISLNRGAESTLMRGVMRAWDRARGRIWVGMSISNGIWIGRGNVNVIGRESSGNGRGNATASVNYAIDATIPPPTRVRAARAMYLRRRLIGLATGSVNVSVTGESTTPHTMCPHLAAEGVVKTGITLLRCHLICIASVSVNETATEIETCLLRLPTPDWQPHAPIRQARAQRQVLARIIMNAIALAWGLLLGLPLPPPPASRIDFAPSPPPSQVTIPPQVLLPLSSTVQLLNFTRLY